MRKPADKSLPLLSVRIDLDAEGRIGPGKIQLLEEIHACGSISAAGRAMNMSYKRAWDLVDEINRICGQPAVERQVGGKNGGGAVLSAFGLSLGDRACLALGIALKAPVYTADRSWKNLKLGVRIHVVR